MDFWVAVREVWPQTKEQRDWMHRVANVLDQLPESLQPKAHEALWEIQKAATSKDAEAGITRFVKRYGADYPKAVASLPRDQHKLLTCLDFPAEHRKHIRTTNPIESPFATVQLRQRVTEGAGSRMPGLARAYKLLRMAEEH